MSKTGVHSAILILLSITTVALSDSGWYDETHGVVEAEGVEHPAISMASEVVGIELERDQIHVKASFTFVNVGPEIDVSMYYPFFESSSYGYSEVYEADRDGVESELMAFGLSPENPVAENVYPLPANDIPWANGTDAEKFVEFRAIVDGSGVPVTLVVRREVEFDSTGPGRFEKKVFARWNVGFREGQERTVVCEYDAPYFYGKGRDVPCFKYNLYTGASWAGSIGEGLITVRWNRSDLKAPVWIKPTSESGIQAGRLEVSGEEETMTWEFGRYEPAPGALMYVEIGNLIPTMRDLTLEELGLDAGVGTPGETTVDNLNFRTGPDTGAERVDGRPTLSKGTPFAIIDTLGEWWSVRLADGTDGWIRWRYVDPDTGTENVYAEFVCHSGV